MNKQLRSTITYSDHLAEKLVLFVGLFFLYPSFMIAKHTILVHVRQLIKHC